MYNYYFRTCSWVSLCKIVYFFASLYYCHYNEFCITILSTLWTSQQRNLNSSHVYYYTILYTPSTAVHLSPVATKYVTLHCATMRVHFEACMQNNKTRRCYRRIGRILLVAVACLHGQNMVECRVTNPLLVLRSVDLVLYCRVGV